MKFSNNRRCISICYLWLFYLFSPLSFIQIFDKLKVLFSPQTDFTLSVD
nr:MAG TPA: hypothetical protein [Caudoviricetes sp.]